MLKNKVLLVVGLVLLTIGIIDMPIASQPHKYTPPWPIVAVVGHAWSLPTYTYYWYVPISAVPLLLGLFLLIIVIYRAVDPPSGKGYHGD
jgi:hypothetical protein